MQQNNNDGGGRLDVGLLPCLPQILLQLLTLDENADGAGVESAIADDPALAARFLSIGPSLHAPASTLHGILSALGPEKAHAILRHAATQQVFAPYHQRPDHALKVLWWRSLLRAEAAEQLALLFHYPHPKEARLTALLAGLDAFDFWAMQHRQAGNNGPVELDTVLSYRNPQALADALAAWGLCPIATDAIRYLQEPAARLVGTHALLRIVHVAQRLADHLGEGAPEPQEAARTLLDLAPSDLERAVDATRAAAAECARRYHIELNAPSARGPAVHPQSNPDVSCRRDLAREVRDLALLDALRPLLWSATGQAAILEQASLLAQLLFRFQRSLYFIVDGAQLRAHAQTSRWPSAFELALDDHHCLAVIALQQNQPLDSFSTAETSVPDQQIGRWLSSGGVLYVPLAAQGDGMAVAAFGIEADALPRLRKQHGLLRRYAQACAQALRNDATGGAQQMQHQFAASQSHIRRVVHEINNPLSILKNYVKLLSLKQDDETMHKDLRIINEEIDRIASMVRSLTQPATVRAASDGELDVNQVIRDILELSNETLFAPAGVRVHTDLARDLPTISTQRDKVKQILLNLLKNAVEAMPGGGTIDIGTRDQVYRDGRPHVEIAITDTGPGLPEPVMARLMQPVSSSKGGDHAGLGLAIVYKLVEEISASITCYNTARGLTIQLLLPRTSRHTAP